MRTMIPCFGTGYDHNTDLTIEEEIENLFYLAKAQGRVAQYDDEHMAVCRLLAGGC